METMPKSVIFGSDVRDKILRGVQILAKAVKTTLGPKGRNVILDRGQDNPVITKDGITVAKSIALEDREEQLGVCLLREATARTGDSAGDGTTTATVLAEDIFTKGLRHLTSGVDPMALKRGIDKTLPLVIAHIKGKSVAVNQPEQIEQIATIAANGERQVGQLLNQAFAKVGRDGIIVLEEAKGYETQIELIEGIQFDNGYINPWFSTNYTTQEVIYEDVLVFLSDKRATSRDLVPALSAAIKMAKPLLFIAEDYTGDATSMLVVNRTKQSLPIVAVKAPGFGDRKRDLLDDFSVATGASLVSDKTGLTFANFKEEHFGHIAKVVVRRAETIMIEGGGDPDKIEERAQFIRGEIESAQAAGNSIAKDFLELRLAKLTGGIARIQVGGATEAEMNERKDRVEDALFATRAAVEEGFLPGGGVALFRASSAVKTQLDSLNLTPDEAFGAKILLTALEAPIRQIALNAGAAPDLIVNTLNGNTDFQVGYNAATGTIENLVNAGVIDPTKVVRLALENAVSAASTLLTAECMVSIKMAKEEKGGRVGKNGV